MSSTAWQQHVFGLADGAHEFKNKPRQMRLKRLQSKSKNKNRVKHRPHLAPLYEQVLDKIKQEPSFLTTLHRLEFWWLATSHDTLTVRGNGSIGPIKKPVQEYRQIDSSTHLLIINNYFVALASVRADPATFLYIGNGLRDKLHIALAAVEGDGTLLRHAGYNMRRNKRVIQAAIKQNPAAEQYAVRDDGDASPDRGARSRSVSPNRQPLCRISCRTCFEMVGNMQIKLRVHDGVTVCAYCNTSVALPKARYPLDGFMWVRSTKDTQGANEVAEEGKEQVPRV
tara:strand:+ start:59 stop:907 length:849 start_codon:yes stop_codon:yes gene_type:complete